MDQKPKKLLPPKKFGMVKSMGKLLQNRVSFEKPLEYSSEGQASAASLNA